MNMPEKNIFMGGSYLSQFSLLVYKKLISRQKTTYKDIMADFLSKKNLPTKISECEGYGELKKAFPRVCNLINKKEKKECIEIYGNNRNKEFLYVGDNDDPLSEMVAASKEAKYKKDLEDYYQFCQDSAGFFPTSWIEHFFHNTLDIFEIKQRKSQGRELVGSGMVRKHKNIEWLPYIYECIRDKKVLEVTYHEKFKNQNTVIFHPHFLKEFNGRWHIFGIIEHETDLGQTIIKEGQNIPLDRIDSKPIIITEEIDFKESENIRYPEYFSDIVGTTKTKDTELYSITIRIYTRYMFGLITTKPIHHTQQISAEFNDKLDYGEVTMQLCPNNEFYGRILQMGHDLEILSPQQIRDEIAQRILKMYSRYVKQNPDI